MQCLYFRVSFYDFPTPILNDTLCGRKRERGRGIEGDTLARPFFLVLTTSGQAPATQATYSALLLLLVLDSCCEGSHSKIDNFASQGKNPIRIEKEFLHSRARSRPPTQAL